MDEALRALASSLTSQSGQILQIDVLDNKNSSIDVDEVFGICKGILWAHSKSTSEKNSYVAIPLCYIFSANLKKA
ncbi:MAG: hypothetical protein E6902_13805 [Paeniclostridium sordellii]|nr:hypothetical protein [Paeniclostridium sordellii]